MRHLWFVFGEKNLDDLEIEIAVDEASEPQVRMPFRSFFGVLLGFEDYHINSAGLANFPNFTITNDVHIPPKASPGWNFYLPIPFSNGCRISLLSKSAKNGAAMVDWQQYREGVELTLLRFHSQRSIALPGSPAKPFPIAETEGAGFLAGYIMGWRQKDHGKMSPDWLKVNQFFLEQLAYIARKLDAIQEGERTALDNSVLMYLSSMQTGSHDASNLPCVVVGGGGGRLQGGRVLDYANQPNRKMCSLYLSLLDKFGIRLEEFGASNEHLAEV